MFVMPYDIFYFKYNYKLCKEKVAILRFIFSLMASLKKNTEEF